MITIAMVSVAGIATIAALGRRWTRVRICPICVGVSGTWIWMLAARTLGYPADTLILAMLLGGSAVGLMYTIGQRVQVALPLFQISFLSAVFVASYAAVSKQWWLALLGALVAAATGAIFVRLPGSLRENIDVAVAKEAEKKLEHCC